MQPNLLKRKMAYPGYACAFRALLERNGSSRAPSVEWVDISSFQLKLFVLFQNKYCWTITLDSEEKNLNLMLSYFILNPPTSCSANRMVGIIGWYRVYPIWHKKRLLVNCPDNRSLCGCFASHPAPFIRTDDGEPTATQYLVFRWTFWSVCW